MPYTSVDQDPEFTEIGKEKSPSPKNAIPLLPLACAAIMFWVGYWLMHILLKDNYQ